jgi:hypothetical protein
MARGGLQAGRPLEHDDRDAAREVNSSIILIALPDIFRRIHLDPLARSRTT